MDTRLSWQVRPVAIRKGIAASVTQLADLTGLNRRTIRGVWETGTEHESKMFEVETLRRLCIALDASPPSVFRWSATRPVGWAEDEQDGPDYLHWRIPELAARKRLDIIGFARTAQVFYATRPGSLPSMAQRLWEGQHRAVSLAVLGRVLRTLDASPGDLLHWVDAPIRVVLGQP